MLLKSKHQSVMLAVVFLSFAVVCNAQSRNLLQNPNASEGANFWRAFGWATIEASTGGNLCFVVRNGGYFLQDVALPDDAVGQFAVFIGRGASERINADGAITGLPYLYGYMLAEGRPDGGKVLAYLQDQRMSAQTTTRDEWVNMWGIFEVPKNTKKISFFLNQAERRGVPHNGSAARFDNLGLYLFPSREEAQAFVQQFH